jgi:hypothetical protein
MTSEGRIGKQRQHAEKVRKYGKNQLKIRMKIVRRKPTNGVKPRADVVFNDWAVGKQEGSYGNIREGLCDAQSGRSKFQRQDATTTLTQMETGE